MNTVSIIGSAGRNNEPFTEEMFNTMIHIAQNIIRTEFNLKRRNIVLVSGGSAWSDHVAVKLFLQGRYKGLKLYVPSVITKNGKYYDTGIKDWRKNPGGTLNYYHDLMNTKVMFNTYEDLRESVNRGAVIDNSKISFHSRNSMVAKSEYCIAFTWSNNTPTDGGTADTWKKCKGVKRHVSLVDC